MSCFVAGPFWWIVRQLTWVIHLWSKDTSVSDFLPRLEMALQILHCPHKQPVACLQWRGTVPAATGGQHLRSPRYFAVFPVRCCELVSKAALTSNNSRRIPPSSRAIFMSAFIFRKTDSGLWLGLYAECGNHELLGLISSSWGGQQLLSPAIA